MVNLLKVYCGSSISQNEVKALLPNAIICPPIRRGDLETNGSTVHAIIDGVFFHSLTISPAEVAQAIKKGCRVYGASSMGALRAAECESIGMTGVGKIFEKYKSGEWVNDDEVAIAVDEKTFEPLSDSLADIRFFLKEKKIEERTSTLILEALQQTYFPKRSFEETLWLLSEQNKISYQAAQNLSNEFLISEKQKYRDARLLIDTLKKANSGVYA